jgi:hypoxanthine phosphoribosyltransferase
LNRGKGKEASAPRDPKPMVTGVSWDEVRAAVDEFTGGSTVRYDLIVGIARGGLPIAVAVAERFQDALFSVMLKRYVDTRDVPFFVFEEDSHRRSRRTKQVEIALPFDDASIRSILVIDDVTTFGNSLEAAEFLLRSKFPSAQIDFYVYAADLPRLSASRPDIAGRIAFSRTIDNKRQWLKFPWE